MKHRLLPTLAPVAASALLSALLAAAPASAHDLRLPVAADELDVRTTGPGSPSFEFIFTGQEPILLNHDPRVDGAAIHVRNFISCGNGAKVAVIEEYIGKTNATYWSNAVTEVFVGDDGSVDHYKIQRESKEAFHFQTLEAHTGTNAVFSNHSVTLGSKLGRNDIRGKLMGEGGEVICNGLYLLKDRQIFDTHMFMDHAVPKCNSHELYKGILDDKSSAVFCGRILVQQDA